MFPSVRYLNPKPWRLMPPANVLPLMKSMESQYMILFWSG